MVWKVFPAFLAISCCRMAVWARGPNLSWMSFTCSLLSSHFLTCGWKTNAMYAPSPTIFLQQKSKEQGDKCWVLVGLSQLERKKEKEMGAESNIMCVCVSLSCQRCSSFISRFFFFKTQQNTNNETCHIWNLLSSHLIPEMLYYFIKAEVYSDKNSKHREQILRWSIFQDFSEILCWHSSDSIVTLMKSLQAERALQLVIFI